jgi:hypothetical protein
MLAGSVFLTPGQEIREFAAKRPQKRETDNGRVTPNDYEPLGEIKAMLTAAKPEEIERWRQLGHPATHKIIMQGKAAFDILPGDIFEQAGRRFYNQAALYNVGDTGHWTIYYC